MSRAFVKESETEEALPVPAPALPPGVPNHVTPAGRARLEAERDALAAERAALRHDPSAEARARLVAIAPRLALLEARAPTWITTTCPPAPDRVVFGVRVTVVGDERRTLQIVGVDEVDPAEGRVSFLSPIARALLGAAVGDVVTVRTPRGDDEVEVVAIEAD